MTYPGSRCPSAFCSILLLLSVGLAGCSSVSSGDPPVADSTFSAVLVDLHLIAARAQHRETLRPGLRDSVFTHHGVRRNEFEATLEYYTNRPDSFEALYNGVLDTLNAIEGNLRHRDRSYDNRSDAPGAQNKKDESDEG